MCPEKRRFRRRKDAQLVVERLRRMQHDKVEVWCLRTYHCPICRGWHLTRQPKRTRR